MIKKYRHEALQLKTVILIQGVGDPYEADGTIAVCSSKEEALKLDLPELWELISDDSVHAGIPKDKFIWKNLKSGDIKTIKDGLNRPKIYLEEVELNKLWFPLDD